MYITYLLLELPGEKILPPPGGDADGDAKGTHCWKLSISLIRLTFQHNCTTYTSVDNGLCCPLLIKELSLTRLT